MLIYLRAIHGVRIYDVERLQICNNFVDSVCYVYAVAYRLSLGGDVAVFGPGSV